MVYSSLGRQYTHGNFLWDYIVRLVAKPTEGGARSLVLAALTTENGRYYTDYQTEEQYKVYVLTPGKLFMKEQYLTIKHR
jgi:hypothetical protein